MNAFRNDFVTAKTRKYCPGDFVDIEIQFFVRFQIRSLEFFAKHYRRIMPCCLGMSPGKLPRGKAYQVTPAALRQLDALKKKRAECEARELN